MLLESRLVAMLDVLGFGSRINTKEELVAIANEYSSLISEVKTQAFRPIPVQGSPGVPPSNFEVGEFVFDTIVLVSNPINLHTVKDFIFSINLLMEKFHARAYPLRGAITIGNYYTNSDSGIFLSDAFQRLSKSGNAQEWAGCAILPEAEDTVISNLLGPLETLRLTRSTPIQKYQVPYKKTMKDQWCLNWAFFLSGDEMETGLEFLSTHPEKSSNTRRFLEFLSTLEDDTQDLDPSFAPARRLRVMKARAGVRLRFEDESTNAVNPEYDWTLVAQ